MHALQTLIDYQFARQALVAAVAVGTLCSLLSVVVVLKRMAFVGHGVSHAGFGGIGTAILLGLAGWSQDLLIMLFCLATGIGVGILSRKKKLEPDSAIGILLVMAMAWGVFMTDLWRQVRFESWYVNIFGSTPNPPSWEMMLFGSLISVSAQNMWLAVIAAVIIIAIGLAFYKEIVFFTFDEKASQVFGVRTGFIYYLILILLSVTIVLSIRLAGLLLVSALLVIPGATGLLMSRKLKLVLFWSWLCGMVGMVGGVLLSLQFGRISSGPCIVGMLGLAFTMAWMVNKFRRGTPRALV